MRNWKEIDGWFDEANYDMFATLKLPKKAVILESGTFHGRSTWALAELFPDAEIHTCDPDTDPGELPENATFYRAKTTEMGVWDKPIDLLFIDNSHITKDIQADWDKYEPFVKKGGYIVFHDYHENEVFDVRDFVNALPKNKTKIFMEGQFHGAVYTK